MICPVGEKPREGVPSIRIIKMKERKKKIKKNAVSHSSKPKRERKREIFFFTFYFNLKMIFMTEHKMKQLFK